MVVQYAYTFIASMYNFIRCTVCSAHTHKRTMLILTVKTYERKEEKNYLHTNTLIAIYTIYI